MGYRLEHEPRKLPEPNEKGSYSPSPEEEKLVSKIYKNFYKAKKGREKYDKEWLDYYKMFRGIQWKEKRPSFRSSEVINLIWRHIQSVIPILTDARPTVNFLPKKPEDRELADIFNDLIESDWGKKNWGQTLTELLYDGHIFGTNFSSLYYDSEEDYGLGGLCWDSEDPFHCYPDPSPSVKGINRKSKYFYTAKPTDIDEIREKYPENGKFVKGDISDFVDIKTSSLNEYTYKSPTDNLVLEGPMKNETQSKQALVITCYMKSGELVAVDGELPSENVSLDVSNFDGQKVSSDPNKSVDSSEETEKKLKYPKGRKVVVANKVILSDGENEYDDGKFPYLSSQNYMLSRQIFGQSEIEQLSGPQRLYNKIISYIVDVLSLMGNPIWVVDNNSGVDTDNLVNRSGLTVEKTPGSEVTRVPGVDLQPYVMTILKMVKELFDDISGSTDASRGVQPGDVDAGIAITQLQEATQTRIRQKSKTLDYLLQEFGQMYESRVLQFYTVPRVVRLTNKLDGAVKYFRFHVEKPDEKNEQEHPIVRFRPYNLGEDGKFYIGEEKQWPLENGFDVEVSTGTALPFAKAQKESETFKLYDRGIIDPQEVLKNLDYPNYQTILDRMRQSLDAQQSQMQNNPRQNNPKPTPMVSGL